LYELFILGELMTGEKHGYMLLDVLKNSVGLGRKISPGTLYPLLSRMTDVGWIHLRFEEETVGGRTRKIYGITQSGADRFLELMTSPFDSTLDIETQLTFRFKMVYFQYVSKEIRLECLHQYLQILVKNREAVSNFANVLLSSKPEPEKQRVQLLRVFDHRLRLAEVEIQWVKEEIERIRAEEE